MQKTLQCAIYTRVSTDMQAEREFNSCESQEEKIRSFINSQENMEIFKVYSDPGFTGANVDRPALQELLQDVQDKKIDLVIAYKIDRLTRSPKDFYHLIEIFDKHGVNFISVTERFDTSTPSGRLLRNIMLTFAQFERELTSERTKDKLLERARKGMWNGGIVPFGYKNENKRLVIHRDESAIVKRIYEDYVSSHSLAKVLDNLKDNGITYRNGSLFSNTAVSYILRNPVYTGKIRFAGSLTQGNHAAIVSQELFDVAQSIHRNKKLKMKLYKDFLFAGLIHCKECGSVMTPHYTNKRNGRRIKRFYYYRCTKTNHGDWSSCSTKQVNANRLEDYIFSNLERISLDKQYLDNLCFSLNHRRGPSLCSESSTSGRIGFADSSKNPGKNGPSGIHSGLELSDEPPKISAEIFAQTIASLVSGLKGRRGIEKNLLAKKYFQSIVYSKESIRLNIFPEVSRALGKEKTGAESAGNSGSENRSGCLNDLRANHFLYTILSNIVHQSRTKNV